MVPIRWLLGFIQATKGSPRTHVVIFTNGRKGRSDSVCRELDWCFKGLLMQDSHQSHSVVSMGVVHYLLLSNGSIQEDRKSSIIST